MNDAIPVLEALVEEVSAGRPAVFSIVLAKQGSAPQSPGAMMLVRIDASTVGTIGGGAVEAEACRRALELLELDRSELLELSLDAESLRDDAAICGGRMSIGVVPVKTAAALEPFSQACERVQQRQPHHLQITVERAGRRLEYRINLTPAPILLIAGAGHVGQALANLTAGLDFQVVVIDDRPDLASRKRFDPLVDLIVNDIPGALRQYQLDENCYVVIATRGHMQDQQALETVIRRPTAYVGMIGSRKKSHTILDNLTAHGVEQSCITRVHTPIGISIGAISVREIAVSIAAELIQVRRQRTSRPVEGPL